MKKIILLLCFCVLSKTLLSQAHAPLPPNNSGAIIDTLYDQTGRKFPLASMVVNINGKYGSNNSIASSNTCTAGYFVVHFANNSGMTGTTTIDAQKRALICEVLANISGMVNPSLNSVSTKVNILIDDISLYVAGSNTAATLGVFSPFLALPSGIQNSNPGIMDNLIYKTITTQQDPYNGIALPAMFISGSAAANFYHGMMAINFNNPAFNFNTNISALPAWNQSDLYTIVLHEMMHALGFASLIGADGNSVFGVANNYYSRYDRFLRDKFGNPLISTSNGCSSLYGLAFSSNTLNLSPNCPNPSNFLQNNTTCSSANYYSSATLTHMPVYTPDCYTPGSSLSHFEDQCYPLVGSPYGNDVYFVISNATGPGAFKRYLKEEERLALCDLGYSVISTYTSNALSANKTYTAGNCSSPLIAGINDGITVTFNIPTYSIVTNVLTPVTINNILGNDINAVSYKCLQTVIGNGTLSSTSGSGSFIYTPANSGIHLLRYIPLDANNNEGNITFIYVNVAIPTGTCVSPAVAPCDLIFNGDFEQFSVLPTGLNLTWNGPYPCGWKNACFSPDYFNGLSTASGNCGVPCNGFGYETDNVPGNNGYFGMLSYPSPNSFISEAIYSQLNAPLQPNTAYTLRFDVSLSEGYSNLVSPLQAYLAPTNAFTTTSQAGGGLNAVAGATILLTTPVSFTQTNGWTNVVLNFTTGATAGQQYIALGNLFGVPMTQTTPAPINLNGCFYQNIQSLGTAVSSYYYIDNVKLTPSSYNATLNIPPTICHNQTVNLTPLASPQGGVFNGNGVVCTGSNCVFNANLVNPGNYNVTYSLAIPSGTCPFIGSGSIKVLSPLSLTATLLNTICTAGQTATLTVASSQTNSMTYTWQPGNIVGQTVTVTPSVSTIYTVTGYNGQCSTNSQTLGVNIPTITFTNLPTNLCTTHQWLYLANSLAPGSPTNGVWTTTSPPGWPVSLWIANNAQAYAQAGTLPGTYTLTYTYSGSSSCSVSSHFTVNVIETPTLTTNGPLSQCTNIPGYTSTLMVTSTSTLPMTYTWNPGNVVSPTVVISPSVNTVYNVVGTAGTCTSLPAVAEVNTNSLCCGGASSGLPFQYIKSSSINNATLSGLYAINQNVVITGTVSLDGEFYFAPNVGLIVANGGVLNTDALSPGGSVSSAHLLSCYSMWNGIQVNSFGRVKFDNGDLIEDAKVAISSVNSSNTLTSLSSYEINLDWVVFNRNRIGVSIKNYTQTASVIPPFRIVGCVFTNRNLPSIPLTVSTNPVWQTATSLTWISNPTNPLASPYTMGGFAASNLKAPFATEPANIGVYVENSGLTTNPTTTNTSFTYIYVGDGNSTNAFPNFFDNLHIGISAVNSNVFSYSNIFQNSRTLSINGIGSYGAGIKSINNNTNILNYNTCLNMVAPVNPTQNINKFYDCQAAVLLNNVFQVNMQFAEIRSTQSKLNPIGSLQPGYFGVYARSNRFKNYTINTNKFLNLHIGVLIEASTGFFNVTGISNNGQVWGSVGIRNNTFSSASTTVAAVGNGFMSFGVIVNNFVYFKAKVTLGAGIFTITPANGVWIQNNNFDRVYRGVDVNNFSNSAFGKYTANNKITLIQDHILNNPQSGVAYSNNYFGVVNSNTITGYTTNLSNVLYGVYYTMNKNSKMECNIVTNLTKGIEFAGSNVGTIWKTNTMQTNARGMQLSSNAIISQQGTATVPSDNFWQGSWTGTNYNTFISSSTPSLSALYTRTLTGYKPLNNGGAPNFGPGSLFNASSITWPPCVTVVTNPKGPNPIKLPTAKAIASNTLVYQGYNPLATSEINRILLFEDLEEDTAFTNSDPALQSFYTSNQTGYVGKLIQIGQHISEGNHALASNMLSTFNDSTNIQTNYKLFYSLYIKYADTTQGLSNTDKTNLNILAHKCPFVDGAIVHHARALNSSVTGIFEVYNDQDCDIIESGLMYEDEEEELMRKVPSGSLQNTESTKSSGVYQLFPNPATDKLYILGNTEQEPLSLEIRDLNDKLVLKSIIQITNYTADLKLNLINGVYFVTLVNQNQERLVKKLVISK